MRKRELSSFILEKKKIEGHRVKLTRAQFIMSSSFLNKYDSIVIGTGNILENEEFKKAKNPTQEVREPHLRHFVMMFAGLMFNFLYFFEIKTCDKKLRLSHSFIVQLWFHVLLNPFQMLICVKSRINELEQLQTLPDTKTLVSLPQDKIEENGSGEEPGKIKLVAKIFLNDFANDSINEGIEALLENCSTTPSVILAYHPTSRTDSEKFIWADNNEKSKQNFKLLWKQLRAAQADGKIAQLGIADMDLDTILDIFDDKNYDFTILQINTQTCCVVPPELQQFCKDHEIQLLTHSDPQGELPKIRRYSIALT